MSFELSVLINLGRIAFFTIRFGVRIQIVIGIRFTNTHSSIRIRVFVKTNANEYYRIRISLLFGSLFVFVFYEERRMSLYSLFDSCTNIDRIDE